MGCVMRRVPPAMTSGVYSGSKGCGLRRLVAAFSVFAVSGICSADPKITQITLESRRSPVQGGKSFGDVGTYETLTGQAHGEIDPKDPLNQIITDIELAPRNPRGL